MKTKPMHTVVVIPNNKKLEISYYCSDTKLQQKEKANFVINKADAKTTEKTYDCGF